MVKFIDIFSNIMTIVVSFIGIYIYIKKRKEIASMFITLMNYSYQLSLSELNHKLEKLSDYNADESEEQKRIIINILHEIMGQIRGNDKLSKHLSEVITKIEKAVSGQSKLTEPIKRILACELRERLRLLNVDNIDDMIGGQL